MKSRFVRAWAVGVMCCVASALGWMAPLWAASTPRADAGAQAGAFVARITLDDAIGPATAEYYHDASSKAVGDGARAIILVIDTPGGLASAMQAIIADILASPIPVIGYVAPGGARAASAGTYILYATHVAAMAPATHLGAATPVELHGKTPMPAASSAKPASAASRASAGGGAEAHKVLNDAIAYIRSLAQLRGRNAAWAQKAVRGAATLTASEAVKKNVVDFVAPDAASVLRQADGRRVKLDHKTVILSGLARLPVRDYPMGARLRFLTVITNPTIAYGLLLVGIWGLVLEGFHPGAILPGTVGAISLLVALYALHLLPVNFAGLALIALGLGMIVMEVIVPTMGAVGLGGIVAFVIGSVMLFDASVPGYGVNLGLIAGIAVFAAGLLLLVLWLLMRSRRKRPSIGDGDEMLGARGVMIEALVAGNEAWANVHGERWRVVCGSDLAAGAKIKVVSRDGLVLHVQSC